MHQPRTPICRSSIRRLAILAALTLASYADAQEWTRFRGPNGSGLAAEANLPAQWTDADYNWKVALPGIGHSSPVIWGDKIFLTCADRETAKRYVLCLSTTDGHKLWQREYDSKPFRQHADNSYATSTPAVDADRVYVSLTSPESSTLLALTHDGKDAWTHDLGRFTSQHGSGSSPIVVGNLVVLCNDQEEGNGSLLAVWRKTGATCWQIDRKDTSAAYGTPCVWQPPFGSPRLIFASRNHGITSVEPHDGKVIWEMADLFDKRVVASPIVASGLIFAQCGEGPSGKLLVAIRPDAKVDGKTEPQIAYKLIQGIPYVPTPVAKGDLLFLWCDSGLVRCVRTATGEEVWQARPGGHFFGSPVCVGDRLYNMSTQGDLVILAASDKYELLARIPLGESSEATPALANGVMYLRTASHLLAIGAKK